MPPVRRSGRGLSFVGEGEFDDRLSHEGIAAADSSIFRVCVSVRKSARMKCVLTSSPAARRLASASSACCAAS